MKIGARERRDRLEQLEKLCREAGIPCTIQRRALLEAVLDRDEHPTANQVFEAVRVRNPQISRATVHRNLETLSEMGVITKTCHPGGVARYDARVGPLPSLVGPGADAAYESVRVADFERQRRMLIHLAGSDPNRELLEPIEKRLAGA